MLKTQCKKITMAFESEMFYEETSNFVETYTEKINNTIQAIKSESILRLQLPTNNCEVYYVIVCRNFNNLNRMELHNILVDLPNVSEIAVRETKVSGDEYVDFSIKDIVCQLGCHNLKLILNIMFL